MSGRSACTTASATSLKRSVSLSSSLVGGSDCSVSSSAPAGTGNASIHSLRCHGLTSRSHPVCGAADSFTVRPFGSDSPIGSTRVAVAVAELDAPKVALVAGDRLEGQLAGSHAYHATRADLLLQLGCNQKTRAAYDKAIELAGSTAETAYLTRRRTQLA